MAPLDEIVRFLDAELRTSEVPDAEPALNGLQLTNSGTVTRIAAAVDFSGDTVAASVREGANLLLVHHGMFWRERQRLVGPAFDRLKAAIDADLAVYSSHIPLDLHPMFGNNILLARELGLEADGTFGSYRGVDVGVTGTSDQPTRELVERVRVFSSKYRTSVVATPVNDTRRSRRWAIITGAGADTESLDEARGRGVDTLIVGEGPHHSAVQAIESGIAVIYGGHYATETLGVRALAQHASERFALSHVFVDVPTGL
ncbi:MAG: Nif3-like dinuclear metal center hexameric protein [Gemmatimonadaceae bacterium]